MNRTNEVKVILLDAGGVLFETFIKHEDRIKNLLMERGYQKSDIDVGIMKANQYSKDFLKELKLITNWTEEEQYYKGFYRTIAKELGDIDRTNELFYFAHYAGHCQLFPEVKGVLETLSKRYRLGVISNALPSMDWIFDWLGIRKYFDSIILSAFVNVSKPKEAIYNYALQSLHANKEECIFIDDKIENIEGAEQVGIRGLHLDRSRINLFELLKEQQLLIP